MSAPNPAPRAAPDQLLRLIGVAVVLGLLDYGRHVLVPIVMAIFLALLLAPLIRFLRRIGLGAIQAVAASVFTLFASVLITALVLGSQAISLASDLPQYEATIRNKLQTIDRLTLGKLDAIFKQADRLVAKMAPAPAPDPGQLEPLRVQLEAHHPTPAEVISKIAGTVVPPLETGGIVLIVLIFILLDYESLRDRMIRLVSGGNFRATTLAITDATQRLSRFFVSQFAVNALVGALVAVGLGLAGLNGALFWGALTAVLRFIPYIGIWLAAGAATLMAAALSDGWLLMGETLALFLFIEIVIAQFFEPRLYGHSTGLSPLSVVVAAIFWSALWGPVGLILSTPLTLCLVVAGRYVPALKFLEILLGDLSALSQAEHFYQRALSGDAAELIRGLRRFTQERPLCQYADQIVLPSMRLGYEEFSAHDITDSEQSRMSAAVSVLIEAMSEGRGRKGRRGRGPVLSLLGPDGLDAPASDSGRDSTVSASGVTQGVVLLAAEYEHDMAAIVARILAKVLGSEGVCARYLTPEAFAQADTPEAVQLVFVVCVAPDVHEPLLSETLARAQARWPHCRRVVMRVLDGVGADAQQLHAHPLAEAVVTDFQGALTLCAASPA